MSYSISASASRNRFLKKRITLHLLRNYISREPSSQSFFPISVIALLKRALCKKRGAMWKALEGKEALKGLLRLAPVILLEEVASCYNTSKIQHTSSSLNPNLRQPPCPAHPLTLVTNFWTLCQLSVCRNIHFWAWESIQTQDSFTWNQNWYNPGVSVQQNK